MKSLTFVWVALFVCSVSAQSSMSLTVSGALDLPYGKFSDPDEFDG